MTTKEKASKPVSQVRNMEVVLLIPNSCKNELDPPTGARMHYEDVMDHFLLFCRQFCHNWIFQLEDSNLGTDKTPNPHIQASIRLRNKKRPVELARMLLDQFEGSFDDEWFKLERIDCRPTSRFNADELNFKYVTKEETRVLGPVTDHTIMTVKDFPDLSTFPAWKRMLVNYLIGPKDHREILNIYDPNGGCGKTTFQKWWWCSSIGRSTGLVDFSGSVGQVLASTVNAGPKEVYFINLPWKLTANTKQEKLDELGQAIESIKDGFLSTSYYGQGKTICFKNPHVVIFSNIDIMELNLFAPDRVKTWVIPEIPESYERDFTYPAVRVGSEDRNIDPNDPIEE